jgi:threonine dehydrogenase-like Zn-dependent dehydrogenase
VKIQALPEIAFSATTRRVDLRPFRDPGAPGPGEVRIATSRVGFCGTDREIVHGAIGVMPTGSDQLVLGHEMVGLVVDLGPEVTSVRPGDPVVPLVRRGCGQCPPCQRGRPDYCLTGKYLEHGITGLDGFARPAVVLAETAVLPVPRHLADLAVLAEPLSIACKALDEARFVRSRLFDGGGMPAHGAHGGRAVVAGVGTIGLLATHLLTMRGFAVTVLGLRERESLAAQLVTATGAKYRLTERDHPVESAEGAGPADIVIEATGDARLAFELRRALGPGGVLVWLGVPDGPLETSIDVGHAMRAAILEHQAVIASVNASRSHMAEAIEALEGLAQQPRFAEIITGILPPDQFTSAIWPAPGAIKQVVQYGA